MILGASWTPPPPLLSLHINKLLIAVGSTARNKLTSLFFGGSSHLPNDPLVYSSTRTLSRMLAVLA